MYITILIHCHVNNLVNADTTQQQFATNYTLINPTYLFNLLLQPFHYTHYPFIVSENQFQVAIFHCPATTTSLSTSAVEKSATKIEAQLAILIIGNTEERNFKVNKLVTWVHCIGYHFVRSSGNTAKNKTATTTEEEAGNLNTGNLFHYTK